MVRSREISGRQLANASGWISEHQGVSLNSNEIAQLWNLRNPTISERATKLLQEFARRHPVIGERVNISFPDLGDTDPSWVAITWSQSISEVQYLLVDYLRDSIGALDGEVNRTVGAGVHIFQTGITPRGHAMLEELREPNPQSAIGFCAMWFADDLKPLWAQAIEPAIRAAGYDPRRIDQHEHVNKIDDEIVAMLRRSKFVVADFTGQRGGVYFEAGYALGLGLRVIWLCREEALGDVHFDTRQYNFLVWKTSDYADLARRLQNRIEATLGRGPIEVSPG
jgi:hypothetical protein